MLQNGATDRAVGERQDQVPNHRGAPFDFAQGRLRNTEEIVMLNAA